MRQEIPASGRSAGTFACMFVAGTAPAVQASKASEALLVPFLGVMFGLPAVFVCVVLCVMSSVLRKRKPRPWHTVYAYVAMTLSILIGVGLPFAGWLFLPKKHLYDILLFAFPLALAGAWSAWLAWLLQQHAKGQQ